MIYLSTERLIIRDHMKEDLLSMHALMSNKKVMYYLPSLRKTSLDETTLALQHAIDEANSEKRCKFFFAILDKSTEDYVGEIGLTVVNEDSVGKVMDLGYFIHEKYWGKGITTEAAKVVIEYAFSYLHTKEITAGCVVQNVNSEKIMKKLGMVKEAELSYIDKQLSNRVKYRLWKDEYEKQSKFVNSTD
ncbi:N-acetyltransferase [Bacillus sp. HMF5848]|uniref:GNAT family N-acetyltransferase n=1 Tax=Bacillus sp. HMF5848 TaxID=2495421 RepID=UPI000F7B44DB|nr:GNAT family protein [Bacillus sp. HMF5848]RSK27542.1 N-acetyltransferase [Bacillus sp. HMF5848]